MNLLAIATAVALGAILAAVAVFSTLELARWTESRGADGAAVIRGASAVAILAAGAATAVLSLYWLGF